MAQAATAEEIREFCRGQIATYKIPRYIRFTTEFPMTVTGKMQKFRMREISTEELGAEPRRRSPGGRRVTDERRQLC